MQSKEPLQLNIQLGPGEVYNASVGIFAENGYELIQVIYFEPEDAERLEQQDAENKEGIGLSIGCEIARVYQKEGQLFILYRPGKDNEELFRKSDSDKSPPLAKIIKIADQKIKLPLEYQLQDAQKHFIVAEVNPFGFFGIKAQHYVKATVKDHQLTIEDSKAARNYDESSVSTSCGNFEGYQCIHRGWQDPSEEWQCGHYVIAALERDLKGEKPPEKKFKINQKIIDHHNELYLKGFQSIEEQGKKRPKSNINCLTDEFEKEFEGKSSSDHNSKDKSPSGNSLAKFVGGFLGFLLGASAGILIGAGYGFALGGPFGMILGGIAGGFIGGGAGIYVGVKLGKIAGEPRENSKHSKSQENNNLISNKVKEEVKLVQEENNQIEKTVTIEINNNQILNKPPPSPYHYNNLLKEKQEIDLEIKITSCINQLFKFQEIFTQYPQQDSECHRFIDSCDKSKQMFDKFNTEVKKQGPKLQKSLKMLYIQTSTLSMRNYLRENEGFLSFLYQELPNFKEINEQWRTYKKTIDKKITQVNAIDLSQQESNPYR